jgi:tellurite resistance protein TerC
LKPVDSVAAKNFLFRIKRASRFDELPARIRRTIVGTLGGLVLLVGVALIFLPGPAFVVIPLGLAILATEFAWARHYLLKARGYFEKAREKAARRKTTASDCRRVNVRE